MKCFKDLPFWTSLVWLPRAAQQYPDIEISTFLHLGFKTTTCERHVYDRPGPRIQTNIRGKKKKKENAGQFNPAAESHLALPRNSTVFLGLGSCSLLTSCPLSSAGTASESPRESKASKHQNTSQPSWIELTYKSEADESWETSSGLLETQLESLSGWFSDWISPKYRF